MNKIKSICIISDSFIPTKISAAGMIYNLGLSFKKHGYFVTFIYGGVSSFNDKYKNLFLPYELNNLNMISSDFLISLRNKGYYLRFIYEIILSLSLSIKILFYFKDLKKIDLVIHYGPSAFLWFPVLILKLISKSKSYYILRDIFPDWLIDLGIIKNKFLIFFLNLISKPQFHVCKKVGVETNFNLHHLGNKIKNVKFEVLNNWPSLNDKNIHITNTSTLKEILKKYKKINKDKIVGVYLGNNSIAHDFDKSRDFYINNIFKFKQVVRINLFTKKENEILKSKNVNEFFFGQVEDYFLPFLLKNSNFGIVTLNSKLLTQNVPGKLISYLQFNLPVLSFTNKNSSVAQLMLEHDFGVNIDLNEDKVLNIMKMELFINRINKKYYENKPLKLFRKSFSTKAIVDQIIKATTENV